MDSSMRVLTRPPNLNHHQTTLAAPIPPPKQTDHPSNGVVVVGFIGRRSADVTYLVNRVLDAHVFGSGNSDKDLLLGFPKGNHWFSSRRISYYYDDDDEKRILYLQFSSTACPAMEQGFPDESSCSSSSSGFDSVSEEELEFGDLQGMLFMFSVTPPFPVVLATCPVIQFEESCLPPSVPDREQKLQFTFGCRVILPPESFLSLRLPFVYGVQLEDGSLQSLRPFEYQPEVTAWIAKGTTLQVISKESTMFDGTSEN